MWNVNTNTKAFFFRLSGRNSRFRFNDQSKPYYDSVINDNIFKLQLVRLIKLSDNTLLYNPIRIPFASYVILFQITIKSSHISLSFISFHTYHLARANVLEYSRYLQTHIRAPIKQVHL